MKAWYVPAANELELIDMEMPAEPTGSQILVRNISFCICNGSDPGINNGNAGFPFPLVFGHEAGGVIEKVGENVKGFKINDRISWWCTIGVFAEYVLVDVNNVSVFAVPENIEDKDSSVLELVIAASRALMPFMTDDNNLKPQFVGKTLTILGLGPSGLVLVQLAKYLGFDVVYGWDLYEKRRLLALEFGADAVADPSSNDFINVIKKQKESDIVIDAMDDDLVAGENTFNHLLDVTKNYGVVVSYGHPETRRVINPYPFQMKNLTMVVPENNIQKINKHNELILKGVKEGAIKIKPLITHEYPFSKVKEVYNNMLKNPGEYIKIIFTL